jgi:hypothetical protein
MTPGTQVRGQETGKMNSGMIALLAWSLCATALILLMAGMVVTYLLERSSATGSLDLELWLQLFLALCFAAYPTVGALVASRRPNNVLGWLLCIVGLAGAIVGFTEPYTNYAREVHDGSLPVVEIAAFLDSANPGVRLAIFVPLFYPDGRLPSRRWRPVAWVAFGGMVLNVAYYWVPDSLSRIVFAVSLVLLVAGFLGAVGSVVYRLRQARGPKRQQIKWLVYAASVMLGGILCSLGSSLLSLPTWRDVFWYVTVLGFAAIPVAVGVAVLKYRLYDIDVIINRTIVYGSLTVVLAAFYGGGIVLLQHLFRILTGQESQVAVVATTLLIAAMFEPLRRRLQHSVDRRFYRSKYDARKTLESFAAALRDETDLDALRTDLVGVVSETVQPAHVSLWLRPEKTPKIQRSELRQQR